MAHVAGSITPASVQTQRAGHRVKTAEETRFGPRGSNLSEKFRKPFGNVRDQNTIREIDARGAEAEGAQNRTRDVGGVGF